MGPMQEMIAQGGRATVLQMVRNRNNLEDNKMQRRLMELNKELIFIMFQLEQEKLNTYDFLKTLKSCDSDDMSEYRSLHRDLHEHPPSPMLINLPDKSRRGLGKVGKAVLQPATRARFASSDTDGRTLDPRQIKSSPGGGFNKDNVVMSSAKNIKTVKEDVKERLEALLREKGQLMWQLEKMDRVPNRTVPPLAPERGGPARPILDPYATEYEKREAEAAAAMEAGPIGVEASIEIARQQFAAGILRFERSKTDIAPMKKAKEKLTAIPEGLERARTTGIMDGRESRPFESPSHTKVFLPKHPDEKNKPSVLTLTKPTFECSTTRRESDEFDSLDTGEKAGQKLPRMSLAELARRRQSLYQVPDVDEVSARRKKEVRDKLSEMGFVKERKKEMSKDDFMRKFIDRKARGMAKRSQKREPLNARLGVFYDKVTTTGEAKVRQKNHDDIFFNLPPLIV